MAVMNDNKRYIFLLFIYILFVVFLAGIELNWASAIGYNLAPLIVSYFAIRGATSTKRFVGASFAVVALFAALNVISGKNRYDANYNVIFTSCSERNVAVAEMGSESSKEKFCTCFADEITTFAMRQDAIVFFGLVGDRGIEQNSSAQTFLSDAFMQCSAI